MAGTVNMGQISHVAFKTFFANLAVENFFLLNFFVFVDFTNILFNINGLLPADQITLMPRSQIYKLFSLLILLYLLFLQSEFLASEIVEFSFQCALNVFCGLLRHYS